MKSYLPLNSFVLYFLFIVVYMIYFCYHMLYLALNEIRLFISFSYEILLVKRISFVKNTKIYQEKGTI